MTLAAGTRLGPYEILGPLGAGGMGEVYRAVDTKLNREVAIKVLPDVFASDADRLGRFTREAQTLAALNHPNILTVHDVGTPTSVRIWSVSCSMARRSANDWTVARLPPIAPSAPRPRRHVGWPPRTPGASFIGT